MALTKAEREACAEVNAIGYLPCEHCGERKFTALRDYADGEKIRLCTDCAGGNIDNDAPPPAWAKDES
jgi:hypothetical protein